MIIYRSCKRFLYLRRFALSFASHTFCLLLIARKMRPRGIQGVHLVGRAWKAPPFVRILFLTLAMTWLVTTCVLFVRHHGLDFVSLSLLTPPDTYLLSSSSNTTLPSCSKTFMWPLLDDPLTAEKSALAPLRCSIPSSTSTTNAKEEELIEEEAVDDIEAGDSSSKKMSSWRVMLMVMLIQRKIWRQLIPNFV